MCPKAALHAQASRTTQSACTPWANTCPTAQQGELSAENDSPLNKTNHCGCLAVLRMPPCTPLLAAAHMPRHCFHACYCCTLNWDVLRTPSCCVLSALAALDCRCLKLQHTLWHRQGQSTQPQVGYARVLIQPPLMKHTCHQDCHSAAQMFS